MHIKFGTAGIRGLTNTEVSPEVCWRVAAAFARYISAAKQNAKGGAARVAQGQQPGAKVALGNWPSIQSYRP